MFKTKSPITSLLALILVSALMGLGLMSCNKLGPGVFYSTATSLRAVADDLSKESYISDISIAADGSFYAVAPGRILSSEAEDASWKIIKAPKGKLAIKDAAIGADSILAILTDYDLKKEEVLYSYDLAKKSWSAPIALPDNSQAVSIVVLGADYLVSIKENKSGTISFATLSAGSTSLKPLSTTLKKVPHFTFSNGDLTFAVSYNEKKNENELYKVSTTGISLMKSIKAPKEYPIDSATLVNDENGNPTILALTTRGTFHKGTISGDEISWIVGTEKRSIIAGSSLFGIDKQLIIAAPTGKLEHGKLSTKAKSLVETYPQFNLFDKTTREQTLLNHANITTIRKVGDKLLLAGVSSSTRKGGAWIVDLPTGKISAIQKKR